MGASPARGTHGDQKKAGFFTINRIRKHPYVTFFTYAFFYQLWFMALERSTRPVHIIHCALDDYIPFCRFAVVPYLLWFAWIPLVMLLFLHRAREEYWRLFYTFAIGTSLGLLIYTIFPNGVALRSWHPEQDVFTKIIRLIYQMDTSTNVCPSMHVFVTVILALAIFDSQVLQAKWFRALTLVMSVAICASTVLLDQHSMIDVLMGLLLAVFCYLQVRAVLPCGCVPLRQIRDERKLRRVYNE
jgi:membrane-associated phospholipid phosphatase